MVLLSTFFLQVLCSVANCNPQYEHPTDPLQISSRSYRKLNDFEEHPVVKTNIGAVRGFTMKTIRQRDIYAFQGIPYGETTAGENRFKAPVPKAKWRGVRDAFKFGNICLQANPLRVVMPIQGSEDCLFLNIYTHPHAMKRKEKLPVLFWIHGGSYFYSAGSDTGPAYLLEHDVILVTINYRLGILGFLSTGDDVVPGNYGLKDQALALKWVHENIEKFGGDRANITMIGESAGAASVNYHMMSPMSQPYFTSGILMSGSAVQSWAFRGRRTLKIINRSLARESRCPYDNSQVFYNCLKSLNPYFLTGMQLRMFPVSIVRIILFGPVDERLSQNSTEIPFITRSPEELYDAGQVAKIPCMFTKTSGEADIISLIHRGFGTLGDYFFREFWKRSASRLLEIHFAENPDQKMEQLVEHYFQGKRFKDVENRVFDDIITDRYHGVGTHKAIQRQSQISPTYAMLISGPVSNGITATVIGAPQGSTLIHADDVFLIFNGSEVIKSLKTTDQDFLLSETLTLAISHFAKFHNTDFPKKSDDFEEWKPVTDPCNVLYWNVSLSHAKLSPLSKRTIQNYLFLQNLGLSDTPPNPYNC